MAAIKKFKTGERVVVTCNTSGHGWPNGTVLTLKQPANDAARRWYVIDDKGCEGAWTIRESEFQPQARSKADIENELKDAQAVVDSLNARLAYMAEVGSEEYEEDEFLAYEALTIVEGKGNKLEKAKALAKLVKSGRL